MSYPSCREFSNLNYEVSSFDSKKKSVGRCNTLALREREHSIFVGARG